MTRKNPFKNYPIFAIPIEEICTTHIDGIFKFKIQESQFIDYKQNLYGGNDEQKVQLLKHICGFANAGGGLLIFGIQEANEIPTVACGISTAPDTQTQILNLIREGIEPTLPGIKIRIIDYYKIFLLLISIPNSLTRPHMVNLKGHQRFYIRVGSSTLPMTGHEVHHCLWEAALMRSSQPLPLSQLNPLNADFLCKLYNASGSTTLDNVQNVILEYIKTVNEDLGSRDYKINSISLCPDNKLSSETQNVDNALHLAKANTHLRAATDAIAKAISSILLVSSFLQRIREQNYGELSQNDPLYKLIKECHTTDSSYRNLVKQLGTLVNTLDPNGLTHRSTRTLPL